VHVGVAGDAEPIRIVARVPGMRELDKGATVALRLDAERIYVFEDAG
jgi:hypothetical protein